jgi:hypothetical protein
MHGVQLSLALGRDKQTAHEDRTRQEMPPCLIIKVTFRLTLPQDAQSHIPQCHCMTDLETCAPRIAFCCLLLPGSAAHFAGGSTSFSSFVYHHRVSHLPLAVGLWDKAQRRTAVCRVWLTAACSPAPRAWPDEPAVGCEWACGAPRPPRGRMKKGELSHFVAHRRRARETPGTDVVLFK